jgi:phosphatidylserine/phosphatidylglycerophosphate/cardiolipin synthase-like enzyme/uncharacterized membrane protein YdjX (TVP38/TMEM64 family)
MSGRSTILVPGSNCERIAPARRVAWLIDGAAYFAALADAIERAQRSVLMVGWDFHSRMRLRRDARDEQLVELLERVVRSRPRLRAHILGWDFAMIYALEREFLPLERFQHRTHRRIHFRLDDQHPAGASHHQKIVVIDDAIAFCGGLDVTVCRWDTPEHAADDPRRSDPGFSSYGPFHDVQMLVDGDAARALGNIARERWHRATGRHVRVRDLQTDPWPASVEPQLRDVGVGIARTQPAYAELSEVRHVERLHVDAIRAARDAIYLENQYFTSSVVVGALADRLAEDEAPEILVVVPKTLSGWLEEHTMGALMAHAAARLREADTKDRLRILMPVLPGNAELTVHSKVAVIDDRLLRIGSANLSNRSMGLDTECDLAVESTPEADVGESILRFRDTLLAEHLGTRPDRVRQSIAEHGSLLRGVDALCGGDRRLAPFEAPEDEIDAGLLPARSLFDPERPIPFEELREQLVEKTLEEAPRSLGAIAPLAAAVALPVVLLAVWQLSPLAGSVSPESLSAAARGLDQQVMGPAFGLLVFVLASLLMVPVVSLIVASALVFGFIEGSLIALVGSVASAAAGYGLGRSLWRDLVRKLAGSRLDRLNQHLSRRGLVATAVVRVVPVAPFAIVNLVAGASRVRLRDFVLGTAIGMAPGTLALAFFGERAAVAARNPSPGSVALAALGVAALLVLALLTRRLLRRAEPDAGIVG